MGYKPVPARFAGPPGGLPPIRTPPHSRSPSCSSDGSRSSSPSSRSRSPPRDRYADKKIPSGEPVSSINGCKFYRCTETRIQGVDFNDSPIYGPCMGTIVVSKDGEASSCRM
jgi:hypothetical protein